MKIKLDHITNSSSSSFLVAFPKKIKEIRDVKYYVRDPLAKYVFEDAIEQEPSIIEENQMYLKTITEEIQNGSFPTEPRYGAAEDMLKQEGYEPDNSRESWKKINNLQKRLTSIAAKNLAEKFIKNNKGKYLYRFSYGDEDGGIYTELEHGGTFELLSHIQISNH